MNASLARPHGERHVYQAINWALAAEETDTVFGLMGDGNMHLVADLGTQKAIRFIAARHEASAVAMADGYSRVTGKPGVCTVTHGPGLTQIGTPLVAARIARSPVLVIAGDTPKANRLHNQNIEQQPFALATAGAFQEMRLPQTVAEDIRLAFRHVRTGGGPVILNVGTDLQQAVLPDDWRYIPSFSVVAPTQRPRPDAERLATVAEMIRSSRRPVVLAGRGAVLSGARDSLVALADRIGAVLATTLLAKEYFAGHPFNLGISGRFASELAWSRLTEADLVLAFGASVTHYTVGHGALYPQATLVQIDHDRQRVGAITPVADAIVADARATADDLLQALGDWSGTGYRTRELQQSIAEYRPFGTQTLGGFADGIDPREVSLVCDALLPADRAVVIGVGHYGGYQSIHVGTRNPNDFVIPWQLASIGLALSVGIGVAASGRPTVVFEGDGGLMMSLPELETLARYQLPVLVIVLDDGAYGAEYHKLVAQGMPVEESLFRNPDFVGVAEKLGITAHRADTIDDLRRFLIRLGPISAPTLIHVPVTKQVVHHEMFSALQPVPPL